MYNNQEELSRVLHKGIYMILLELHSAYSNQLTASGIAETSSSRQRKLFAPPLHCFSAASLELLELQHSSALTTSVIA